ncbi:hypothetical protein LEP1GSC170_0618 [Leptospira interrogans serovar Bataviae str. HAI135]|nr:hypothetical protein LEP1GSC170_0618 [Leptospira interrogans serovar Bataviae str. HAI135]
MCVFEPKTRPLGKRFAEFDSDSKILFNLWVRLWLFYCRRISFVFGVFKNHRFVNYSSLNRYKLAKNRWYKDGVHNQVAEENHRLVKTAFSAYEYIRPKFNQLYLNEFSFLKNINVLELDSLESKRLGENFKNSSDEL